MSIRVPYSEPAQNHDHGRLGLLDFKFKMPHHVAHRLFAQHALLPNKQPYPTLPFRPNDVDHEGPSGEAPRQTVEEAKESHTQQACMIAKGSEKIHQTDHPANRKNATEIFSWFLRHSKLVKIVCILCLLPLIIIDVPSLGSRQQIRGCIYLMISPITNSGLLIFNLHHKNSKPMTMGLAMMSALWSNAAGIAYCSSSCFSNPNQAINQIGQVCLSLALITGAAQLLMLMSKTNIPIVMISTASGVMVCSLAMAANFVPSNVGKRCYQSTIPCILWLFWQAAQKSES